MERNRASRVVFNNVCLQIEGQAGRYKEISESPNIHYLTPRQFEIVKLICSEALSNKEAVHLLGIRLTTFKNHLRHIYSEFGIKGSPETKKNKLIAKLMNEGLLTYVPSVGTPKTRDT